MAEHLIYHWKHGWIPLTHAAALSKAKGNHKLADRYVPGSSQHEVGSMRGKSARQIHATLGPHADVTHPVGTRVNARQPGVEGVTRGVVMGHQGGIVQVAYKDRHGNTAVGRFNPHHVTAVDAPATATPGEVANLKSGDVARVAGMDEFGQQMSFTGRVQGVSPVRIKRGQNGKPEQHFAVQIHNGSDNSGADATARTTVYVPRATTPDSGVNPAHEYTPEKGAAAAQALQAAHDQQRRGNGINRTAPPTAVSALFDRSRMTPTQERAHVHAVQQQLDSARAARNPGRDTANATDAELAVMATRSPIPAYKDAAQAEINRRAQAAVPSAPVDKRVQIDHSGDGTTLTIDRNDHEARAAAKAAGFKWSSNLGAWYLPRTWSEPTRRYRVENLQKSLGGEHVHVNDGGRGVTTTAAEREAAARASAASRADRMDARAQRAATEADVRFGRAKAIGDMIPFGQPILVGHHSEGRHRRDLAKIGDNMRKGFEAQGEATSAAAAADRARRATEGDSPLLRQRRIDRNEAEVRKIDRTLQEHNIATKAPAAARKVGFQALDPSYHEQLLATRAKLTDEINHDRQQIADSGHKAITSADLKPGDIVHYRGRPHVVKKVNKTTVSVPTGYSWDDKVPINQISRHQPLSAMSDSAVESAAKNETDPKVKAHFVAELNRRGIKLRAL